MFRPKHTIRSIASEIADGLRSGRIELRSRAALLSKVSFEASAKVQMLPVLRCHNVRWERNGAVKTS